MKFYRATLNLAGGADGPQSVSTWTTSVAAARGWIKGESADAEAGGQAITDGFVERVGVRLDRPNVLRLLNRTPISAEVERVWDLKRPEPQELEI